MDVDELSLWLHHYGISAAVCKALEDGKVDEGRLAQLTVVDLVRLNISRDQIGNVVAAAAELADMVLMGALPDIPPQADGNFLGDPNLNETPEDEGAEYSFPAQPPNDSDGSYVVQKKDQAAPAQPPAAAEDELGASYTVAPKESQRQRENVWRRSWNPPGRPAAAQRDDQYSGRGAGGEGAPLRPSAITRPGNPPYAERFGTGNRSGSTTPTRNPPQVPVRDSEKIKEAEVQEVQLAAIEEEYDDPPGTWDVATSAKWLGKFTLVMLLSCVGSILLIGLLSLAPVGIWTIVELVMIVLIGILVVVAFAVGVIAIVIVVALILLGILFFVVFLVILAIAPIAGVIIICVAIARNGD